MRHRATSLRTSITSSVTRALSFRDGPRLNLLLDFSSLCAGVIHDLLIRLNLFQHWYQPLRIPDSVGFQFVFDLFQSLRNAQPLEPHRILNIETDRLLIDQTLEEC